MIEAINKSNDYLDELDRYWGEEVKKDLSEEQSKELITLLSNPLIKNIIDYYNRKKKFSLENLTDVSDVVNDIKHKIDLLKEDVEVNALYIKGELFNWDQIEKIFNERVKKEFPQLDFNKLKEWVRKPKKMLLNEKGQAIVYDSHVIKKINTAIMQNIFDEMDMWTLNTGAEGSGKSCLSSQFVWYVYSLLKDIGLVTYKYDLEKFTKASIKDMLDDQIDPEKKQKHFNIYLLDEAEDLLRSNHSNSENKRFLRNMRRSRKDRSFVFLNSPQIGELNLSLTLARVNFIFDAQMSYNPVTGLLKRGFCDFYIIPRGDEVYSRRFKRNFLKTQIKNTLLKIFEKKTNYYSGLPKDLMICQFKFNHVWGFDQDVYKKHITKENYERDLEENFGMTEKQAKIFVRCAPDLKYWHFAKDELTDKKTKDGQKEYDIIRKFKDKIQKKIIKEAKMMA